MRHARAIAGRSYWHGTVEAGALGLRSGPGRPIRWGQGWLEVVERENPGKDNEITQENFNRLLTIVRFGRWHGEEVIISSGGGG